MQDGIPGQLPGMRLRQVLADNSVGTAQLRIAIESPRREIRPRHGYRSGRRRHEDRVGGENSGRGIEAVEVFRRTQKILVEAGLRRQGERRREIVVGIEFGDIVLDFVGRRKLGLDYPQIARLRRTRIGVDVVDDKSVQGIAERQVLKKIDEGQTAAVHHLKRIGRIERGRKTTLAQIAAAGIVEIGDIADGRRARIGLAKLFRGAQAVVILGKMFPDEIHPQAFDGLEADGKTPRPQIAAIDALVRGFVEGIALALGPFSGKANVELIVNDGQIDHAFNAAAAIIADIRRDHRFKTVRRFGGNQIDHACRRVAAIERALRSTQDFYLADIVEFLLEEMIADERNIVERDRDSRIGRRRNRFGTDTTDGDVVAGKIGFGEVKVRHLPHQIGSARRLRRRQLFLRHRRNRDRDVLNIAADFRRGDGHGFQRRAGDDRRGNRRFMYRQHVIRPLAAHDRDHSRRIAAHDEPRPSQNARQSLVRRQLASGACRMDSLDRLAGQK